MADRWQASKGLDRVEGDATTVRFERTARRRLPLPGGELHIVVRVGSPSASDVRYVLLRADPLQ
jgi:hypothetical protein